MTSTDTLIRDLSIDFRPVARRSMWREAFALVALGLGELALLLIVARMRPDMGLMILTPAMIWKIGSLAVLAGVTSAAAIRSFSPQTESRQWLATALGLALFAAISGIFMASAAERGQLLMERIEPMKGLLCSASIVALALPMMTLLGFLMRRAAPVHPERSALATGLAAATFGALIFTARCPMGDPLYIIVWYSAGVAAVTATARWLLPRRFRL